MKRLFDLICSGIGLLALSPLFALVAVSIKFDSPGPVFFKQERVGRGFKPFHIFKFRTMFHNVQPRGPQITAGGDTRITRMGHILRKTKVDELPQLINVLKGEMSLVGPRPEVRKYVEFYKKDYQMILCGRPGITDISSIMFRNEESLLQRQDDPEQYYLRVLLPEKIRLAQEYIQHQSLFYDLKLIFKTFYRIVLPSNKT